MAGSQPGAGALGEKGRRAFAARARHRPTLSQQRTALPRSSRPTSMPPGGGRCNAQHRTHALADAGQLESDADATCKCHRLTHTERTSEHDTGIRSSHCCRAQSKVGLAHWGHEQVVRMVGVELRRQQGARMALFPLGRVGREAATKQGAQASSLLALHDPSVHSPPQPSAAHSSPAHASPSAHDLSSRPTDHAQTKAGNEWQALIIPRAWPLGVRPLCVARAQECRHHPDHVASPPSMYEAIWREKSA